jgi:two-component system response regulator HydG
MHATGVAPIAERDSAAPSLLIVDQDRNLLQTSREAAHANGFNAFVAESVEHAYRCLEAQEVEAVLLDVAATGRDGLHALRHIKSRWPEVMVIITTAQPTVSAAVEAMKLGAYDYLAKPFTAAELKALLQRVQEELKTTADRRIGQDRLSPAAAIVDRSPVTEIVGRSPAMEKLYRIIEKAAQSTHPVLILGESGTGKELAARCIHFSGPTRNHPFIVLDCASLLPGSIEGELFGYVKGAFPGASRSKDGLMTIAEGGTLFLDEVGELPLNSQGKLLRAIQEHAIQPLGASKRIPINVRILAATNRDLEHAVAEGRLRRDFYFRLNVLTLRIPPLRERKQDIPLLAQQILDRLVRASGRPHSLGEEALEALVAYDWPGNVRELESCLERACTMSSGPVLRPADFPSAVQDAPLHGSRSLPNGTRVIPLARLEKQAILSTIDQLSGDKLQAARLLGIGKTTLYRKLKEYARE